MKIDRWRLLLNIFNQDTWSGTHTDCSIHQLISSLSTLREYLTDIGENFVKTDTMSLQQSFTVTLQKMIS